MNDITRFFSALYSPYPASQVARLEIRCKTPGDITKGGPRDWFGVTEDGFENASAQIRIWREKFDVYHGVLPRAGNGGEAKHIRLAGCLWADMDAGEETVKEAAALLTEAVGRLSIPAPHILVRSGGGLHAYWLLSEPVVARAMEEQERFKRAIKRLVQGIGGDLAKAHACPKAFDVSRILRPPGSNNHKQAEPRPVTLVRCEPDSERHPLLWWEARLPALPLPPPPKQYTKRAMEEGELHAATVHKLETPAPDGKKHYTMLEVAVAARKRGHEEYAVRAFAEQVARNSGVNLSTSQESRHLENLVVWVMRSVDPDPETRH